MFSGPLSINQSIELRVRRQDFFAESHCFISENAQTYCYQFHLSCEDCLLDLQDQNYELLFHINKDYFNKYQEIKPTVSAARHSLCSNSQTKLVEIIKSNGIAPLGKLLIESNLLYLIYKLDSSYQKSLPDCESCAFLNKPMEREKIISAKNYILKNLSTSLTIPIIAGRVGTNQCYLKKGFKEVYDKTIYEFVQEQRMVKANHLLNQTEMSISDVALEVGYAAVSSFSQAFKNYYGINPKVIKAQVS